MSQEVHWTLADMLESFFNKYVNKFLNWDGRNGGCTDIVGSCAYQGWVCHANVTMVDGLSFLGGSSLEGTPHLEANKYLSKIRKSISCIFSKYYMLTHKKQKKWKFSIGPIFFIVGLKLYGQNRLFKGGQNQNNQI